MQGKNKSWISISVDELSNYDWDRLIIETKGFIEENLSFYDELVDYVWQAKGPVINPNGNNQLRPQDLPQDGLAELPERKPVFRGVNIDFLAESKRNKTFGDSGEDLVLKYERNNLSKAGFEELAEAVKKVPDGKGYDILSFSNDGKEKHIEVKTTTSSRLKPFPISWNEIEYMKQAGEKYFLYRLYNYDPLNNSADFFILEQNVVEKLFFRELNFEAFIKKVE